MGGIDLRILAVAAAAAVIGWWVTRSTPARSGGDAAAGTGGSPGLLRVALPFTSAGDSSQFAELARSILEREDGPSGPDPLATLANAIAGPAPAPAPAPRPPPADRTFGVSSQADLPGP